MSSLEKEFERRRQLQAELIRRGGGDPSFLRERPGGFTEAEMLELDCAAEQGDHDGFADAVQCAITRAERLGWTREQATQHYGDPEDYRNGKRPMR